MNAGPFSYKFRSALRTAGVGLALLVGLAVAASAGERALSKEELLNRLETRQAQLRLEQARTAMKRAQVNREEIERLFDEKIETIDTLNAARQHYEEARLDFEQAQIDLQKTRLEFLKGATLVTVVDAKKYRGPEGEVMVSVRIRNDSDIDKARVAMGAEGTDREKLASLLKIDNIIVSLRADAIIGDPFQRIVPELRYGEEATLTYRLLKRTVDQLTVTIAFLESVKEYTVFLKKEATQDLPSINSTQYAQQGQLGTKVRYDLELERLAKTEQSFSLVVLNLPRELPFVFLDPGSGAHITQLKFSNDISKQSLQFEVSIPAKLEEDLIDANIDFTILVTRQQELRTIYALRKQYEDDPIPADAIAKLKGNKAQLILIPKGTGKLDLVLGNLFKEIQQGTPEATIKFNVLNSGTLALRRISPSVDPPLEWEATLAPREVELLDPGDKKMVVLTLVPPPAVPVGEYTLTLACEGHAGSDTVEAAEKDITVRIRRKSNITGTLMLVAILVILVLAIAVASVKISRR